MIIIICVEISLKIHPLIYLILSLSFIEENSNQTFGKKIKNIESCPGEIHF